MVASINSHDSPSHPNPPANGHGNGSDSKNRVLRVLMRRLHSSKTFGENMIFMLNRARESRLTSTLLYLPRKGLTIDPRTDPRGFVHATARP